MTTKIYGVKDAAERLQTSTWTVRKLIAEGKLRAFQRGENTSPFLITEEAIIEYEKEVMGT